MRDFQEFIDKKIAVQSTDEFMKLCNDKGLLWLTGEESLKHKYRFVILNGRGNGRLTGDDHCGIFKEKGFEIVPATEFIQPRTTIEIFQSKQTTVVCLKKQDGKVVAVGKAKCNPEDEFDFDYGAKLAFTRLWTDINQRNHRDVLKSLADAKDKKENGIKTLKNGMRIKKQDFYEVGDRVLMKKKQRAFPDIVHPGEVGVITAIVYGNCYEISFDGKEAKRHYSCKRIKGKVIQ